MNGALQAGGAMNIRNGLDPGLWCCINSTDLFFCHRGIQLRKEPENQICKLAT